MASYIFANYSSKVFFQHEAVKLCLYKSTENEILHTFNSK